MNRINSIRNLALAIALSGLSLVGGAGCAVQATDHDVLVGDETRSAHFVSAESADDESTGGVEQALDARRPLVHPNNGNNLGPRPEPWMSDGEANGPRPEPWAQQGDPESSGGTGTGTGTGTSASGGMPSSTSSSSGGTPGNPNPSSK